MNISIHYFLAKNNYITSKRFFLPTPTLNNLPINKGSQSVSTFLRNQQSFPLRINHIIQKMSRTITHCRSFTNLPKNVNSIFPHTHTQNLLVSISSRHPYQEYDQTQLA